MTTSPSTRWRYEAVPRFLHEIGRQAASHPLAAWIVAAVYVAVGIHYVFNNHFLNDEGLLAYYFAGMLWDAPLDIFFWQKSRPILSLFYAPAAAAGLSVFLIVHVVVVSLAGPLVASVARGWGHRYPNLAALLVLGSPMMVAAGPAGVTNADAAVVAVLAVWLMTRGWFIPAGLVLGSLFFVRAELTPLVVALGSLAAFDRRFRPVVVGIVAFPVAYWLLGIFYHHDVLWIARYPPSLLSLSPANVPLYEQLKPTWSVWATVPVLMALTPLVGIALLSRWGGLAPTEKACVVFAIGFLVLIRSLPHFGAFNFGLLPRYALPALPFLALMVSRTFTRWHEAGDPRWSAGCLAALLVVAHLTDTQFDWPWLLLAVAVWSALAALAAFRHTRLAVGLAALAAVVPVPWLFPATELAVADTRRELAPALAWLAEHPEVVRAGPVYTNMHLLATYSERTGAVPGIDVRQVVQSDVLSEATDLSNPHVGQRDRLLALLEHHFYATPVLPSDLRPDLLPEGTLFVLDDDIRLESVMPADVWEPHLDTLASGDGWRILVFRGRR